MKLVQPKTDTSSNAPFFQKGSNGLSAATAPFMSAPIQAKLSIGQPHDPYEKEADNMADQVVQRLSTNSLPIETNTEKNVQRSPIPPIQAKCASCEQEEKLQKKEEDESEEDDIELQRKPEADLTPTADESIERKLSSSKGSGDRLSPGVRAQMEPAFGSDFSGVRVHTGSSAVQMSKQLNAQAFTHGSDIYFNTGKYDTNSKQGNHLLAHELTHVVQQGGAGAPAAIGTKKIQRQDDELDYEEPVFGPTDQDLESDEEGLQVEQIGIVEADEGTSLWPQPNRDAPALAILPMNTRVFVDRLLPGNWYKVYVEGHQRGQSLPVAEDAHGYIPVERINTDMPDPNAWFFRITKPGQGGLALAAEVYQGQFKASWGKDYRYLTNVLVAVNDAKERKFIYKENPDDSWDETKTMKGGKIWVPGIELVDALHGHISSGSISYEVLSAVGNFFIGLGAFIVGLLHGALMSIVDIFVGAYDLIELVINIFIKLFKGTLIADAKAFFEDISKIKMSDIIDMVGAKWNAPSIWDRWKFRGYVIGYAIMEILLMVFSVGILTAVKWAGKLTKIGKLAEYLSKLPKVQTAIKAAQALKGKGADKIRAALKAAQSLSKLHAWAAKVLRIPLHILRRLSETDIGKLQKLPQWVRERFARLSERAMLKILGCNSPCKVNVHEIEQALKLATKAGTKLTDADSVIAVLKKIPGLKIKKISAKLRKKSSALMTAIKEAGLTDTDFAKLADFLTPGDLDSPAQAYKTFVRYLTSVVPVKVGPDIKKLNKIMEEMLKAELGRGRALKGAMFEQWVAVHIPSLSSKTFKRMTFDLKKLLGPAWPRATRTSDTFVHGAGEVWDMKHRFGKVDPEQLADYTAIVGKALPDGTTIKSINYLFPTKAAAEMNKGIISGTRRLWYIEETTNTLKQLL